MKPERRRSTETILAMLLWLTIALAFAAIGHYFLELSFWAAFVIGVGALAVNGIISEIADREHW